jgi:hypothetical protein
MYSGLLRFDDVWTWRSYQRYIALKTEVLYFPETLVLIYKSGKPGSSVSIVFGYSLEDRVIDVRFPECENFSSSLFVQNGSGAHPASCTMGTGGKARPGRDADHSPAMRFASQ